MKLGSVLRQGEQQLESTGISSARLDVLIMLEDMLHKDRAWILAHPELELNKVQVKRLLRKVERRSTHVPMAHIRGHSEFYGRTFKVNRLVLEPRPESETMITLLKELVKEERSQGLVGVQGAGEGRTEPYMKYGKGALEPATPQSAKSAGGAAGSARRPAGAALSIADVGTGNGAIGITAALELPNSIVDLYDISAGALAVAKHNVHLHELKLHARKMNLLSRPLRPYDVLLANLPYVPDHWEINQAALLEPKIAIFGGKDGLDIYRKLFHQLHRFTWKPKFILTESLPPQHDKLESIAQEHGFGILKKEDFIQVFTPLPNSAVQYLAKVRGATKL